MNQQAFFLEPGQITRLLGAANSDAALLYLYLRSGNIPSTAADELRMSGSRVDCALAVLRQLGLWSEETKERIIAQTPPAYTETDVNLALSREAEFKMLIGEVQRLQGRVLSTDELKILLGMSHYLGLPTEVISLLVSYCRERARQRGNLRAPSLHTIEKEAYAWAERGIDTAQEAAAFIQMQNARNSRVGRIREILQIRGRNLTNAETEFAAAWAEMGFDDSAIALAYEQTCINTGNLNWRYMNSILKRWHEAGWHNAQSVKAGDRKPVPQGASGEMGQAELEAIQKLMKRGDPLGV